MSSNENNAASDDEESQLRDDVVYGLRRSRNTTNFHHRDSSSLFPGQMMERDVYYAAAEDHLYLSLMFAQAFVLIYAIYHKLVAILDRLQRFQEMAAPVIDGFKKSLSRLRCSLGYLLAYIDWAMSYGELALLYAEDLTIFIRPRRNRFRPKRFRSISEIDRADCDSWFQTNPHNLRRLFVHWRVPAEFRHQTSVWNGEECFIIFLYRIRQGTPCTHMARHTFGGDPRRFSPMFDVMLDHLYKTFYNKISGRSMEQWIPRHLDRCRGLIYNSLHRGAVARDEYFNGQLVTRELIFHHFDYDTFRPFGFLDDKQHSTARPGDSARRRENFLYQLGLLRRFLYASSAKMITVCKT